MTSQTGAISVEGPVRSHVLCLCIWAPHLRCVPPPDGYRGICLRRVRGAEGGDTGCNVLVLTIALRCRGSGHQGEDHAPMGPKRKDWPQEAPA